MIHPAVSTLAERNMTRARILDQAAAAHRPGGTVTVPASPAVPPANGPATGWACSRCGDAWYGTPPDDPTCPGGCRQAA